MSAKATGKVSAAVMASRILGLLREMMFAGLFGGSKWMDCFYLAFKVPNLLRDLFAEGALSQAFVTTFSKKLKTEGDESAWALANKMMTLAAVFMSLVTLLGILIAPWIVEFLTSLSRSGNSPRDLQPGGDRTHRHDGADDVSVHPASLAGGAGDGHAQRRNVFGMPALSSCFFNLGSMIGGAASAGGWIPPGENKACRVLDRRGDRRIGAARLPVPRAAGGRLSIPRGFQLEGLRRAAKSSA
jgi:putative peptidoglycan lipid II flippase